ncbi:hypothetical protein R3Q06_02430 [Rhodococcus erythropolis]|uniref:hypothetical protein n=1 Tax=Rhodococcus erythropolis TaxID=1833 RepID=UPI00294A0958|nr:hypothetical protein [Rhodococcus erythropolis]MDV6272347.1 hypothetical protein [Rhodococcus erythropolis]
MNTESSGHVDAEREDPTGSDTSGDAAVEAKELADEMDKRYEPGARESVTVPGTGGTVAGTAFADHVTEMSDERVEDLDKQFSDFQSGDDDSQLDEG